MTDHDYLEKSKQSKSGIAMGILQRLLRKSSPKTPQDLTGSFSSLGEWQAWQASHPQISDPAYIQSIITHGQRYGVASRFLGHVSPREITVVNTNYRESFLARGLNPRQRIMLDLVADHVSPSAAWEMPIYAPEAVTQFALLLRGRYARFIGSEYVEDIEQRQGLLPILFQDLLKLEFPTGVRLGWW